AARAVSARHWRFLPSIPRPLAIRSMVKNPRLWGVNWYSIPGLPKPTISFTRISSQPSALSPQLKASASLFLFLLLSLGLGLTLALTPPGRFLPVNFLLTLLDHFGFRRCACFRSHCLRCGNHFFLHGGDV